jgi:type I restriction enzyme R subunit
VAIGLEPELKPFADKGGLQKAWGLFERELDTMISELNRELMA